MIQYVDVGDGREEVGGAKAAPGCVATRKIFVCGEGGAGLVS